MLVPVKPNPQNSKTINFLTNCVSNKVCSMSDAKENTNTGGATLQNIKENLEKMYANLETELAQPNIDKKNIDELRLQFLGKKGKLTTILKELGKLKPQERADAGKLANQFKEKVESQFTQKTKELEERYYQELANSEWYDVTLLPKRFPAQDFSVQEQGHRHPISITQKRLEEIFTSMGFSIMDGPQVETDYYNFEALNFTDDHPARDMQDTFYTTQGHLLRTHTSPVQVRGMKQLTPPMRMIAPGRVFRYEEVDASHEHTFYQMEGMIIDKHVSVSHLIFVMKTLLREIFGKEVEVRLRPGYFPFVEPGFELDMRCLVCEGEGCAVCKHSGWVEVLPCGLVHPNVLQSAGLNPNDWQGAAFGLGLNRLVMMEHAIEDIRYFQNPTPAFLRQF